MTRATTKKTVLEVYPEIYTRVRKQATKANETTKRFTTLLLEFGIQKLEAGEIFLVEAAVSDAPKPARKVSRKGAAA